jgi:hypothetical protein
MPPDPPAPTLNPDSVPAELAPGNGDPVLAYGPFVVELDAGRAIGMRLAYEVEQLGTSLRWDEADTNGRAHFMGDVDWVAQPPTLVSAVANGGTPVVVRPIELRDLAGTAYEGLGLAEAVAALRADNRWAWAD